MRKLLATVAVGVLAIAAGLWQPSDSSAASLTVVSYLYHPTGAGTAYLSCGWHDNCDGVFPDSPAKGLDWRPCGLIPTNQPCPYDQVSWVRFWSYTLTGSGYVAQARSFNATLNGCPGISTEVRRWSNNTHLIATIRNNHSQAASVNYMNIYASTTGSKSSGVTGAFLDPGPDPCSSYWHTMQWYISGPYDNTYYKNAAGFPGESTCRQSNCAQPFGVWTKEEYGFSFTS
jgi:hypothetical protein